MQRSDFIWDRTIDIDSDDNDTGFTSDSFQRFYEELNVGTKQYFEEIRKMHVRAQALAITRLIG